MALGHRILVPLDGSSFAQRALPLAEAIAARADGELHLVSVRLPQLGADRLPETFDRVAKLSRAAEAALESYLERTAEQLADAGRVVHTKVLGGVADRALLDYCNEQRCDLVVMATHGRGGFERFWLGSVADRVARHSDVPVLLVPAATPVARPRAAPDGDSPIRTVLIPLDGSELSERVLPIATALGEGFGAEYVLFRAVPPLNYPDMPPGGPLAALMAEYRERDRAATRHAMDEVAGRMREAEFSTTVMVGEEADPTRGLLRLAESTPGAVIAMATHGHGGLRRAVLGSVTDKIVRAATRPVLLVRPSKRRTRQWVGVPKASRRRDPDTAVGP